MQEFAVKLDCCLITDQMSTYKTVLDGPCVISVPPMAIFLSSSC